MPFETGPLPAMKPLETDKARGRRAPLNARVLERLTAPTMNLICQNRFCGPLGPWPGKTHPAHNQFWHEIRIAHFFRLAAAAARLPCWSIPPPTISARSRFRHSGPDSLAAVGSGRRGGPAKDDLPTISPMPRPARLGCMQP